MTMLTGLLEQHAPLVALAILATFVAAIAVSELKERRRFPYEEVEDDIELPLHETTISSYSDKVAIGKLRNGDRVTFMHRGEKRTAYLNSIQVEAGITTPVLRVTIEGKQLPAGVDPDEEHPAYKVGYIGYARAVLPMPKRFKA